jgi:hypothetical protein
VRSASPSSATEDGIPLRRDPTGPLDEPVPDSPRLAGDLIGEAGVVDRRAVKHPPGALDHRRGSDPPSDPDLGEPVDLVQAADRNDAIVQAVERAGVGLDEGSVHLIDDHRDPGVLAEVREEPPLLFGQSDPARVVEVGEEEEPDLPVPDRLAQLRDGETVSILEATVEGDRLDPQDGQSIKEGEVAGHLLQDTVAGLEQRGRAAEVGVAGTPSQKNVIGGETPLPGDPRQQLLVPVSRKLEQLERSGIDPDLLPVDGGNGAHRERILPDSDVLLRPADVVDPTRTGSGAPATGHRSSFGAPPSSTPGASGSDGSAP